MNTFRHTYLIPLFLCITCCVLDADRADASLLDSIRMGFQGICFPLKRKATNESEPPKDRYIYESEAPRPDYPQTSLKVDYVIRDQVSKLYENIGEEFGMTGNWRSGPQYEKGLHHHLYNRLSHTSPLDRLRELKMQHPAAAPVIDQVLATAAQSGRSYKWDWREGGLDIFGTNAPRGEFRSTEGRGEVLASPLWNSRFVDNPLSFVEVIAHETAHIHARDKFKWSPGMSKAEFMRINYPIVRKDEVNATMAGVAIYKQLIAAGAMQRHELPTSLQGLLDVYENSSLTDVQRMERTYRLLNAEQYESIQMTYLEKVFANPQHYFR